MQQQQHANCQSVPGKMLLKKNLSSSNKHVCKTFNGRKNIFFTEWITHMFVAFSLHAINHHLMLLEIEDDFSLDRIDHLMLPTIAKCEIQTSQFKNKKTFLFRNNYSFLVSQWRRPDVRKRSTDLGENTEAPLTRIQTTRRCNLLSQPVLVTSSGLTAHLLLHCTLFLHGQWSGGWLPW